jgi:hypothetical protein
MNFIQPLRVWLDPAGFLELVPGIPGPRVAHGNQSDAVRAADTAGLLAGLLNRVGLFIGDMEDHVGVGRAAQVSQGPVYGQTATVPAVRVAALAASVTRA